MRAAGRTRCRDPNGRRRGKTFKTKQDAINFLRPAQADVVRGPWVDPNRGKTRFKDWADRWYDTTAAHKPKTRAGYRDLLKRLVLPRFGRMELGKIRPIDVTEWVADL